MNYSVEDYTLENDDHIWTTCDGTKIPITELSDDHLLNCIKMCRNQGFLTGHEWGIMSASSYEDPTGLAIYQFEANHRCSPQFDTLIDEMQHRRLKELME